MTKEELITLQQLRIYQLEQDNESLIKCIKRLRTDMVCIGGPLNDNFFVFSEKQLAIFYRMDKHIEEVTDILERDI